SMEPLYTIDGTVIEGKKRGRHLGFPTANTALTQQIPSGIYISSVKLTDTPYAALTFIGEAKTFHETIFQAETWILDFDKDIYGYHITITLLKKIRDNQKFESSHALIEQMKQDEKKAREWIQLQQSM